MRSSLVRYTRELVIIFLKSFYFLMDGIMQNEFIKVARLFKQSYKPIKNETQDLICTRTEPPFGGTLLEVENCIL